MNIAELYKKNQMEKEKNYEKERVERRIELANNILLKFQNEKLVEDITETLIKRGLVIVTGFGCLCQDSFCSWQKGFTDYLDNFHKTWKEKGVSIRYGIDGVVLSVDNVKRDGFYRHKLNIADYDYPGGNN